MHFRSIWIDVFALVSLALMLSTCAPLACADDFGGNAIEATNPNQGLNALVRNVLQHEINAEADDRSLWCYRKLQFKDGKQDLFAACQTSGAQIDRLLAVDGQPLNEAQRQQEDQRIETLLNNRPQLKKQNQQEREDARQAAKMLKMLPDAFVFQEEGKEGNRLKLTFTPNPQFHPSNFSAQVFHQMDGTLTLDLKQQRLVEISGKLNAEVKFFGGLLGHLDKGGTFFVEQREVAPGCWEMTTLDVEMSGKALFFKTIAVRTKEIDTDFHPAPLGASIQQMAALTNESSDKNMSRGQR